MKGDEKVDAKSIFGLMTLAAEKGATLTDPRDGRPTPRRRSRRSWRSSRRSSTKTTRGSRGLRLPTYALQRYDERKLAEAIAALEDRARARRRDAAPPLARVLAGRGVRRGQGVGRRLPRARLVVRRRKARRPPRPHSRRARRARRPTRTCARPSSAGSSAPRSSRGCATDQDDLDCEAIESILGVLSAADVKRLASARRVARRREPLPRRGRARHLRPRVGALPARVRRRRRACGGSRPRAKGLATESVDRYFLATESAE